MKEFMTIEKIMELIIGGVISCIITLIVTFIIDKVKGKKEADVIKTSAQDNISESHNKNLSEISKKIDIHDNVNCNFYFHECTDPKKDQ